MTRMNDHQGDDPPPDPPPHTWLELQRRFDQVDRHVTELRTTVKEFDDRVKDVEITLARGTRFPPWAGGIVTALVVQIGTTVWWASGINASVQGLPQLEQRLTSAFQGMRNTESQISNVHTEHLRIRNELDSIQKRTLEGADDRWRKRDDEARMAEFGKHMASEIRRIEDKVTVLDGKVVGHSEAGWHKSDHQLYAEKVDTQLNALEKRLVAQEERSKLRDVWWDKLRELGALKGKVQ